MKTSLHCLAISLYLTGYTTHAHGGIVSYNATGVFTSSDFPSDIAVGDPFTIDFAYDDSISDSNTGTFGNFAGALRSLDFRLLQGVAIGQYAGGYLTTPGEVETIDGISINPDRFYARVDAGTFPQLGGNPFGGFLFVLDDPSHTSSIIDFGGNPTLASVLNGDLVLSQFKDTTVRIGPTGKNGTAEGVISSLKIVPEPSSALLLLCGAALCLRRRSLFTNERNA